MDHLSEAQITLLRGHLDHEALELRERIAERSAAITESTAGEVGDIEDKAAREAMYFQAMQLLIHDRARLADVEAAISRMDAGVYGTCEETDEPIPFRRLEIDPATRYTADAQEQIERDRALGLDNPNPDEPIAY